MEYTITNSNGMSSGAWSRTYDSRKEARAAIAAAYGWADTVLSPSWDDDAGDTCWSVYETQEECDADETGAMAPTITRREIKVERLPYGCPESDETDDGTRI